MHSDQIYSQQPSIMRWRRRTRSPISDEAAAGESAQSFNLLLANFVNGVSCGAFFPAVSQERMKRGCLLTDDAMFAFFSKKMFGNRVE